MTDIFRTMCVELVELSAPTDSIPQLAERLQKLSELASRTRAALAQPEPVAPTDEELDELKDDYWWLDANHSKPWIPFARAVLERYGTPAIEPVPVSERLPEDADVNKFGQVWWFDSPEDNWILDTCEEGDLEWLNLTRYTHWLPCTAIPTPTREESTNA